MLPNLFQQMRVQPARTELPNARVSIRALEVCTARLEGRIDVPASAPLVGDHRSAVGVRDTLDERGIGEDGLQAVVDREGVALDISQSLGEIVIRLLGGEDQVGHCRPGHSVLFCFCFCWCL